MFVNNGDMSGTPTAQLHAPETPTRHMTHGEVITRAREAYIATHWAPRWLARSIRRGRLDWHLRGAVMALHDTVRPLAMIVCGRDEQAAAVAIKTIPSFDEMDEDTRLEIAGALLTAVRIGRRG